MTRGLYQEAINKAKILGNTWGNIRNKFLRVNRKDFLGVLVKESRRICSALS